MPPPALTALLLASTAQVSPDWSSDFELSEGLAVTLWAETPQLYNPTAIDVDEEGRLWVVEGVDYRRWGGRNPGFEREGGDRVVVLEDTDGDGRCDLSSVFAQAPELVAPLGICVLGQRVLVSCSPSILEFRDLNGDGDALDPGEKEVFLTGFGGFDHDHGVHSLVPGPQGRLYFAVGNAGPHIVTDRSGWTLRAGSVYRSGGAQVADNKPGLISDDGRLYTGGLILSVNRNGTGLAVEAHNFRNPYEVTVDSNGELYTFDNDDEVAACRASWILRGGNHGFFAADGSRTWRADQRPGQSIPVAQWHMQDPGVVPGGTITGTGGPTGVVFYGGGVLEPWFGGQLLAADAGRGIVFAFEVVRSGVGLELVPRPPVLRGRPASEGESARWFRPSDVELAPDGTLYVADWYDPGVGGHGMGDSRTYGRILRVAPTGTPEPVESRERARVDRRLEILRGMRALPPKQRDPVLVALARPFAGDDPVFLEAFGMACEGREEEVFALLSREMGAEPGLWSPAFAALAWRLHPPSAVPAFAARAMDRTLAADARRQALDALAFIATKEAADAMARLALVSPDDLRAYAAWWLENRATNEWAAWVDRSQLGGGLEEATRVWNSGIVRQGRHAVDVELRGATKLWLVVTEGEHGNGYDWADWLAPRFDGGEGVTRLVDLDWLEARTGWGTTQKGKNCDGGALVVEGETFADGIGTHAPSAIAYGIPEGALRFLATAAPDDMGSRREGSTNELEFEVWLERPRSREHVERLSGMAFSSRLDPPARLELLKELALDPEGGLVVLRAAERGQLPEEWKAPLAEPLFQNPDLGVRARASGLFQRAGDRPRPTLEALLALEGDPARGRDLFLEPRAQCATCHALQRGGRRRGGDIGPELTGVGAKLDATRLFDAILNPSAEIAHGFETWRVETTEGELVAGFLLADGPTLILKDTRGEHRAIDSREVLTRERETLSTMPDGVAAGLTDQELADLVAFLREDTTRTPEFGPAIELFNGRDLDGWTYFAPGAAMEEIWSVKEGVLSCKGRPAGYLRTEARYTNFELTLEWRFDPEKGPGNSGVLLRQVGEDKVWPKSIEAQLQSRNAGDIWNIDRFPMAVDEGRTSGRHTARRAPSNEKPLGEWNRYRIRLDRGELELWVNGELQNTASWCQETPGAICLQSEGAAIEFRNVSLRPILN